MSRGASRWSPRGLAVGRFGSIRASDLGRRHAHYGVTDSHYDTVGAALVWTLEQGLGSDWTPEVKAAWHGAYSVLAGVMRGAAREADRTDIRTGFERTFGTTFRQVSFTSAFCSGDIRDSNSTQGVCEPQPIADLLRRGCVADHSERRG